MKDLIQNSKFLLGNISYLFAYITTLGTNSTPQRKRAFNEQPVHLNTLLKKHQRKKKVTGYF